MSVDDKFKAAQRQLEERKPKLNNNQKLEFYGVFKQATVGKNTTPQPKKSDLKAYYKWTAWNKVSGLTQDQAKEKFVELANKVLSKSKL